jgi:hypothetical protein
MKTLLIVVFSLGFGSLSFGQNLGVDKFPTFEQVKAEKESLASNMQDYKEAQKRASKTYKTAVAALKNSKITRVAKENLKLEFLKAQAYAAEKALAVIETLTHFKMIQARAQEAFSKGWKIEEIGTVVLWDEKMGDKFHKQYNKLTQKDISQATIRQLMAAQ